MVSVYKYHSSTEEAADSNFYGNTAGTILALHLPNSIHLFSVITSNSEFSLTAKYDDVTTEDKHRSCACKNGKFCFFIARLV